MSIISLQEVVADGMILNVLLYVLFTHVVSLPSNITTTKHFRHHNFWPPCDTNGWYPNQPEVSQLSLPLPRNRKDRVRLKSAEPHHHYRPSVQKILRIPNNDSEFLRIPQTREKLFCVESVLTLRIIQFKLLILTSELAISNTFSNWDAA